MARKRKPNYEICMTGSEDRPVTRYCDNDTVALSWAQNVLQRAEKGEYHLFFLGKSKDEALWRFELHEDGALEWWPA
jgi:hypothetical protein